MNVFLYTALFLLSFALQAQSFKVVGNVSSHLQPIEISSIAANKLTHLHYNYARVVNNQLVLSLQDSINLIQLQSLKKDHPDLKLLLSIGGENGSIGFSKASSDDGSRVQFASSTIQLIKKYKLDGIELHWVMTPLGKFENKYDPTDHYNYALLIEELRVALDEQSIREGKKKKDFYILSVAGSNKRQYLLYSKLKHVIDQIDYITLQTYAYKVQILNGGGVSPRLISGHHTNLYGSRSDAWPRRSVDLTVQEYIQHGIPAEKIVLGAACYGKGWIGVTDEENGLCQMTDGILKEDLSYKNIASTFLHDKGYKRFWDKTAKAAYLYNKEKSVFISYENKKSIRKKTKYIRKNKLAGAVIDQCQQDDRGKLTHAVSKGLRKIRLPFL